MASCLGHSKEYTKQEPTFEPLKLPLPKDFTPQNNGWMPYIFTVYRWNKKQLSNQAAMERDFLAVFEQRTGCYPYWFGDEKGLTLVMAMPNPETPKDKGKNVIVGLTELNECDAQKATGALFSDDEKTEYPLDWAYTIDTSIVKLYDHGYVLCKKTDKEILP